MAKFVKRVTQNPKKAFKKRYGIGKNRQVKTATIAKDVMKLMAMVNAEKKINTIGPNASSVAQAAVNLTGALCLDVTPMMAEGADQFQRNGISLKLHTQLWQIQLFQQSGALSGNTYTFELWQNKGPTMAQTTLLTSVYEPSVFSGIIDMTSSRNPDHFNDFSLIKRYKRRLSDPAYAGDVVNATFKIPIKFNNGKGHHIRYTGTGSTNYLTDVQAGQLFIICRADNGNSSTSAASTLPIAVTAIRTGITMNWAVKTWFYDN